MVSGVKLGVVICFIQLQFEHATMAVKASDLAARVLYGAEAIDSRQLSPTDSDARDSVLSTDSNTPSKHQKPLRATHTAEKDETKPWQPAFWQPRPLAGPGGLFLAISCVFAALAVLVASHGQPVKKWSIQPTVSILD